LRRRAALGIDPSDGGRQKAALPGSIRRDETRQYANLYVTFSRRLRAGSRRQPNVD
jgi:hypothetical protein